MWDPNEYQGRSEEQVRMSQGSGDTFFLILIIALIVSVIVS